jgi:galactonate dehydratase
MKIARIETHIVPGGSRNLCIVRIESSDGTVGLGESGLSGRELAVRGALNHFGEFLLGRDPRRIGAIWQEVYRSQYFEGGRVLTAALSAIDIALHDLVARSLGVPVYQLLGGSQRDRVPCFATTRHGFGEEAVADVLRLVDDGWPCVRLPVPVDAKEGIFDPRPSIGAAADTLIAAREAIGHRAALGIDYHHRLSVAEAASLCQAMPPGTIDFLEEPIRDETPGAYQALQRMTQVPMAIGEEFASKWQFLPYLEAGIPAFARLDICNVGGFTEAMKVVGWCEAHYIDLMPHNPLGPICTAASIHLAAAVPNFDTLEDRKREGMIYGKELFPVQPALEGNRYPVPTGPGLGVEFNEDAAGGDFKFWEGPHLHRRDGSYTNW